jgi:hypothetical protein
MPLQPSEIDHCSCKAPFVPQSSAKVTFLLTGLAMSLVLVL